MSTAAAGGGGGQGRASFFELRSLFLRIGQGTGWMIPTPRDKAETAPPHINTPQWNPSSGTRNFLLLAVFFLSGMEAGVLECWLTHWHAVGERSHLLNTRRVLSDANKWAW